MWVYDEPVDEVDKSGARRKASRLRHFARRCTVSVRHLDGGARSFTLDAAFCSMPSYGAAQGRGDRRLPSARCRDAPAPKASGRPTSKARSFRAAKVARARGNKSGAEVNAARPSAAQQSFQVVAPKAQ